MHKWQDKENYDTKDFLQEKSKKRTFCMLADFLYCWASTDYYKAYIKPKTGSLYSSTLCATMKENFSTKDPVYVVKLTQRKLINSKLTPIFESSFGKSCTFAPLNSIKINDSFQTIENFKFPASNLT